MVDTTQKSPETLAELIQALWTVKKSILIGASIGLLIAIIYTAIALSTYKITMIVGAVPSISTQISLDTTNPSPFVPQHDQGSGLSKMNQDMYRTIYRSPRIASMVLKIPEHVQAITYDKKYGLFSLNPKSWTADDMSNYFEKRIKITPVQGTTDLFKITYTHPNPDFGQGLLMQIHALTDESIRNDHKKLINDRRAYITKALDQSLNLDHKKALGHLLIDLEREAIMVNSDRSFSMRVIDPPSSSASPYYPRTKMIWLLLTFIGGGLGAMVGFTRKAWA